MTSELYDTLRYHLHVLGADDDSGSGTVDFEEFVAGLSAFSSKGGREEKLRCTSLLLHLVS
jgi:Ca2+-binding EF-hand superfamily protein